MFIHTIRPTHAASLALGLSLLLTSGCDEPAEEEVLEILGEYTDEWAETHTITEATWTTSVATFHIEEWDADGMYLVAQNDEANEYSPGLWSRFDWAWSNDDLFYCQSVFDGATVDEAHAGSANHDDLLLGCGGFPWTNMTPG